MFMFWIIVCVILYVAVIAGMCWSSMHHFPKDDGIDSFIKKNTKRYKERKHDSKND